MSAEPTIAEVTAVRSTTSIWLLLVPWAVLCCGRSPPASGEPFAPISGAASAEPVALGLRPEAQPRRRKPAHRAPRRPAPVGGWWLRCYSSFQPRTDPRADVARLAAACGNTNGMKRVRAEEGGELVQGGRRAHLFHASAGRCYRIFAVAEPSVGDLDLEVYAPDGRRVAFETGDDRWPIVEPDRPFCAFDDGQHRLAVHAQRGTGRYAFEIWSLESRRGD